ncbi:MAG: hypothetical protein IJF96_01615 [Firmicutes bacterium]|nr:hypothetical protein [Bacillota bacterium]
MVRLLIGHKGSGKTKKIVELANDSLNKVNGSVVFINKNSNLTTNLKYSIRLISMNDFEAITNVDEYIGFLYGIISQDHDLECIFIDSILKHADIKVENLEDFLARIDRISKEHDVDMVVSISADKTDLGPYIDQYEIVDLTK